MARGKGSVYLNALNDLVGLLHNAVDLAPTPLPFFIVVIPPLALRRKHFPGRDHKRHRRSAKWSFFGLYGRANVRFH